MQVYCQFIVQGLLEFIQVIVILIIVTSISVKAGLLCIISIIVFLGLYVPVNSKLTKAYQDWNQAYNSSYAGFLNVISNSQFITRNAIHSYTNTAYSKIKHILERAYFSITKYMGTLYAYNQLLVGLLSIGLILLLLPDMLSGTIASGVIVVIYSYSNELIITMYSFMNETAVTFTKSTANYKQLRELLAMESKAEGTEHLSGIQSIKLQKLSYIHPISGLELMHNFSYTFEKGKVYSLHGENGAGKTSLFHLLCGEFGPEYQGEILIDGHSLKDLDTRDLRASYMCFVDQQPILLEGSLRDNLVLGVKRDVDDTTLAEMLESLDAKHLLDKGNGLEEPISFDSQPYSGGEMQKISIIRALLKHPDVLFLDEPNSALDAKSTQLLMKAIQEIKKHCIVFLITHDPELANFADETVELKRAIS